MMRLRSSFAMQGSAVAPRDGSEPRRRLALGEVLGLDPDQQRRVVQRQSETGRLFGETAVELGFATDDQVRRAIEQQLGFSVLDANDGRINPLVVSAFDPNDVLARIARDLRGSITAALRSDGQAVRSVALTGRDTAAELPVLAANLAVACAQTGVPTLLIDADLNQPHQHALFRLGNRTGLATLLATKESYGLIQPAAIENLSLLTTGPAVPNAPELFDRQRLAGAVELLAEDFNLVLVDVGCAATAPAAALGLDAVVVLVRRNITYMRDVHLLVNQLEANGQLVLGIVIVD